MVILKEQGAALDVVKTIELLPESTPMQKLTPWLTQALQNGVHHSRHMAIATKLYQMENLRVKANNANLTQRASRKVSRKRTSKRDAVRSARDRDDGSEDGADKRGDAEHQDAEGDDTTGSLPRESTNDDDLMAGW